MTRHVEGITSLQVPDSTKIVCPRCNSTLFYLSSTLDNPNDIVRDRIFAALGLTNVGNQDIQGLVALCHNCGNEYVPWWIIFDVAAFDGTTGVVPVDLVATVANGLADHYLCIILGTDVGKYVEIATNSIANPSVIATKFNVNTDADGMCFITNRAPIGFTKITA